VVRDHVAVDVALAARLDGVPLERAALRAARAGRVPQRLAGGAALDDQAVLAGRLEPERVVVVDRGPRPQRPLLPAGLLGGLSGGLLGLSGGLEAEQPPPLRRDDLAAGVPVGPDGGDEATRAERRLLLRGDRLDDLLHADVVARHQLAVELELRVGRDDGGVPALGQQLGQLVGAGPLTGRPDGGGIAPHRPRLHHRRGRDDPVPAGGLRGVLVQVDGVVVLHRLDPVPDHGDVHRVLPEAARQQLPPGPRLQPRLVVVRNGAVGTAGNGAARNGVAGDAHARLPLGSPSPCTATMSRSTSLTPPPKVLTMPCRDSCSICPCSTAPGDSGRIRPAAPRMPVSVRWTSMCVSVPYAFTAPAWAPVSVPASTAIVIFPFLSRIASRLAWVRARSARSHGSSMTPVSRAQSRTSSHSRTIRPPSAARPMRSWLSCVVIRPQPPSTSPTTAEAGTRTPL